MLQIYALATWVKVIRAQGEFAEAVDFRFDVYSDFFAVGRFFKMDQVPANRAMNFYNEAFELNDLLGEYLGAVSFSILLVCLQTLLKMDFHPRMGLGEQ
jgi:hypothetical protein